jgi:hypothetical protein
LGDAIACHYSDKYSLKQLLYHSNNSGVKQSAGFLSDKIGFEAELQVLIEHLQKNIACILCDLTNTIRHGDICLFYGNDPRLIEVKSAKGLNKRGRKQRNSLNQLHEFFENDFAITLRGLSNVYRVSPINSEVLHFEAFNDCLERALKNGSALESPEEGLWYLAVSDSEASLSDLVAKINGKRVVIHSWNERKTRGTWPPFYPYMLSIRSLDTLYAFLHGDLYICVAYDQHALSIIAERAGYQVKFEDEGSDSGATFLKLGSEKIYSKISEQMLSRIAYDLTSPAWLIELALAQPKIFEGKDV